MEELAKKLGYSEDAQVMAVKSVLPRDVYGICMTYKKLNDLKTFLIELFSNPKMREAVPGTASAAGDPSVFSIGQHMENNVVSPTVADVSKIHQDMNALQVRFNKITSADFRSISSKPWKPEVTPPRRRGGFNRGRGGRHFDNVQRNDRFKNSENNGNQNGDTSQRNNTGNFRGRGQGRGNFISNIRGKGRGRGRFDKSPNIRRPRVASKRVDNSDASIEGTGTSLCQIQGGKPKLIGYASKTLPEACSRYSVTKLEMTGLLVNMNLWKNLLKHREFDAAVDHAAVAQIMEAKTEPATTRIMRLLDRLSAYSYIKGRDMILSDYLSRHREKDLDPSELIPISFCCLKTYRGIIDDRIGEEIFCIKTRASVKASGETVGEVHGADKPLDPNYKPEHQSKSKLPSVTGNSSSEKILRKPILQTPSRHTPRRLATPKSVRIQSEVVSDMIAPDSNPG